LWGKRREIFSCPFLKKKGKGRKNRLRAGKVFFFWSRKEKVVFALLVEGGRKGGKDDGRGRIEGVWGGGGEGGGYIWVSRRGGCPRWDVREGRGGLKLKKLQGWKKRGEGGKGAFLFV